MVAMHGARRRSGGGTRAAAGAGAGLLERAQELEQLDRLVQRAATAIPRWR
jgi:hypothetical protein